jgi:hypothetical protein
LQVQKEWEDLAMRLASTYNTAVKAKKIHREDNKPKQKRQHIRKKLTDCNRQKGEDE